MPETLLIRADAGPQIGLGHMMRCLALAEPWKRAGDQVVCLTHYLPENLAERLKRLDCSFQALTATPGSDADAAECARVARETNARWVVIDGYHFSDRYQQQLKESGLRLLAIDDYGHAGHYWADYVLNQTVGTSPSLYHSCEPYTRLLLGARFVLIRREFHRWRPWERPLPEVARRILVTLGGSDAENATQTILESLLGIQEASLEITAIIGPSNPRREALEAWARQHAALRLFCAPPDVPALMAEAELGITASGITAWEMAFMGLPQLAVILADNQRGNAAQIEARGIGRNLGRYAQITPPLLTRRVLDVSRNLEARAEMARRGRKLIDGFGATRVYFHLNEDRLSLRRMEPSDCRQAWEWANDPAVRAVSFSSDLIPWANHVAWFHARLNDPHCVFYFAAHSSGAPVGQVRFDLKSEAEAVVSVSVDSRWRNQGLGSLLIWSACRKLLAETPVQQIWAWIKPDNQASAAAFQRAGFEVAGIGREKGQTACRFALTRFTEEA